MIGASTSGRTARAALVVAGLALWVGRGATVGPFVVQPIEIATVVACLAVIAIAVRNRLAPVTWVHPITAAFLAGITVALVAIMAAAVLSAAAAPDVMNVVRFVARYVLGLGLLLATLHLVSHAEHARVLEAALLAGAWLSVLLSVVALVYPPLGEVAIRYGDRAQGLLSHPNQLALLLSSVAPIAFALALRRPRRIGPWLTLGVVGAGVALTGSKLNLAVLVTLLPAMALLAAQLRRGPLRRLAASGALMLMSLAVAAMAAAVVQTTNPRTLVTIGRLITDPLGTSAVATRTETWAQAIGLGLERPWFGVGADGASSFLDYSHAHNVFVEFFFTLGATGLFALLLLMAALAALCGYALVIALARTSLRPDDRLRLLAYAFSILAFVIANQSSESFGGSTLPILWLVTALTLAQVDRCVRA